MKKKINIRLVGIALLAILATVIGVTLIYYNLFQEQIRNDLRASAKLLRDTRLFEDVNIDPQDIDMSTDITELRVTWIAADGSVLYDNDVDAQQLSNHLDRREVQEALSNGSGECVRLSDTMKNNTFYYAMLLDNGTVLRVSTDAKSLWSIFISSAPLILAIVLFVVIICVIISHFLTKQLVRPVEIMAERIEDTEYETPYKELEPFEKTIRAQHADILSAAKARQDFTANVSHELKTPLTAISGYAELLESGMVGQEQQTHFYQEIRKNANRLLALITDIIHLSEMDRYEKVPDFERIDLCDTVKECMEGLELSARQRNISLYFDGKPCTIYGNVDMIKELTENLVQNAIRYNTPGGKVNVMVDVRDRPSLLVLDDGIGIPAAEQERIFERFYRVDKSRSKATGGTGLGLAIVKHIVELHDAKIKLDSAPGVGTAIEIIF